MEVPNCEEGGNSEPLHLNQCPHEKPCPEKPCFNIQTIQYISFCEVACFINWKHRKKFEVSNSLMPGDYVPKITSHWSPIVILLP